MSALQSGVLEAFRAMDVPEEKGLRAAKALSNRDDEITDIKTEIVGIKIDIAGVKTEISHIKSDIVSKKPTSPASDPSWPESRRRCL